MTDFHHCPDFSGNNIASSCVLRQETAHVNQISDSLTPPQQAAVETVSGPLMVLAGPGSGKTRTITHKIAHLLQQGVAPTSILAITFTNKAAREMDERLVGLVGHSGVGVFTFHRLCARLLRRHAAVVGIESNYTILDMGDQRRMMKETLEGLDLDTTHFAPERVLSKVSNLKNDLISPEQFARSFDESVGDHFQAVVAKAFPAYQRSLLQSNSVDFDDLLMHVAVMVTDNDGLREQLSHRFQYILVDEYQDTNAAQYRVAAALASTHHNLCVTGDPDQSIYGWRGARIANILNFERDFPEARIVRLEDNFRSTQAILRTADHLIHHNLQRKAKTLKTGNEEGSPVRVIKFDDGTAEADFIAESIASAVHEGAASYKDIAIFYRVNSMSREIEHALSRQKIPYQVAQGTAFYDRAEVKDIFAYLRLLANPSDRTAFQRIINKPARRLGQTSQKKLASWADNRGVSLFEAAANALDCSDLGRPARGGFKAFADMLASLSLADSGSVAKLLRNVVDRSGYLAPYEGSTDEKAAEVVANVEEVISAAAEYDRRASDDATLEGFLEESALVSDTDSLDDTCTPSGSVTLMTLHASKGLEFPRVFLVGLEQGLLPHERSLRENSGDDVEEERRLLFVGITRAEKELVITHTAARVVRGRPQISIQSQFLPELQAEHDDRTSAFPVGYSRSHRGRSNASSYDGWEEPAFDIHSDLEIDDAEAIPESMPLRGQNETESGHDKTELASGPSAENDNAPKPLNLPGIKLTTAADLLSGSNREVNLAASFAVGQQVRHPHYGIGEVTEIGEVNRRRKVTVDFGNSIETLIVGIAPLEPA